MRTHRSSSSKKHLRREQRRASPERVFFFSSREKVITRGVWRCCPHRWSSDLDDASYSRQSSGSAAHRRRTIKTSTQITYTSSSYAFSMRSQRRSQGCLVSITEELLSGVTRKASSPPHPFVSLRLDRPPFSCSSGALNNSPFLKPTHELASSTGLIGTRRTDSQSHQHLHFTQAKQRPCDRSSRHPSLGTSQKTLQETTLEN